MKIIWSPLALARVREIACYIARDKPHAAERWVKELFKVVGRLAKHPRSCRTLPELNREDVREVIHGNYRVIYKIEDDIHILTVRHGRQLVDVAELAVSDVKDQANDN